MATPFDRLRAFGNGTPLPVRLILAAIGILAVLVPALIVATSPRIVVHKVPHVIISKRIVPKTELPPVEPVTFQEVAATDAKAINGQIPFSTLPNPAARPFRLFGSPESQARAVDCLAAAEIYEAGGGDSIGERAVAQVVINRMKHPAFPKTICGVVFQGSERTTGCQFSFTCDGAMLRWPVGGDSWQRAREIARQALNGAVYAPVGHATHYHTDWVVPYWSASLEKITAVHTHLFFRWAGWWGTPPAFTRGYAGAEPNVPLMSRVSAFHHGDPNAPLLDPLATSTDPLAAVDPASIKASDVPPAIPADGNSFLVTLPKGMSPDNFASLAIRTCGDRTRCKFMAWADGRKTAPTLPLNSEQVATMSFSYLRDETQSFAKALWNCDQYRRPSPVQCMRAQPLARPPVEAAPVGADGKAVGPAGLPGVRRKEPVTAPVSNRAPAVTFTLPAPKATPTPKATPAPARN